MIKAEEIPKENISSLSSEWAWVKLGDVLDIQGGSQPPKSSFIYQPKEGYVQLLQIRDFGEKGVPTYVPFNKVTKFCKKDDIMIARYGASLGRIITGLEGAYNVALAKVIDWKDLFEKNYIFYLLKTQIFQAPLKLLSRSAQNGFSKSELAHILLPLPNKAIQRAIVIKIEELLSELDNGKRQLQTAQQQLKVYRKSILKCAFEGKLTKNKGKWRKMKLGEVANAVDPQPSHRTPPIFSNGIPYVSIKDFDSELDKIDLINARKVSPDVLTEHLNRYTLQGGDFVIGKIGTIGKPVRVILPQDYSLSANIVLIQPRKVNPTYLYYFFQSNQIEKAFKAGTNATTQAAFGIQKVRELQIDLPNEKEQQLIVEELESKLTVCDKIEETISQSLQHAEILRQSILKQAFEGKLVTFKETNSIQISEEKTVPIVSDEFPRIVSGITSTDLQVGIISMVIQAHENSSRHLDKLNHVKCEKISDLVERKLGISLGRIAMKDAAGPDDFPHLKKVEHRAKMASFFTQVPLQPVGHTYKSQKNMQLAISKVKAVLSENDQLEINKLIETFLPFEMEHAELIATLFAGWNNLLILGNNPTDEEIVYESRENWSKRKVTIPRENFFKTLDWMKNHSYIPEGKGLLVLKKTEVNSNKRKSKL